MAHADLRTVPAAGEVARQRRALGQAQLAVELLFDVAHPVVVHTAAPPARGSAGRDAASSARPARRRKIGTRGSTSRTSYGRTAGAGAAPGPPPLCPRPS